MGAGRRPDKWLFKSDGRGKMTDKQIGYVPVSMNREVRMDVGKNLYNRQIDSLLYYKPPQDF